MMTLNYENVLNTLTHFSITSAHFPDFCDFDSGFDYDFPILIDYDSNYVATLPFPSYSNFSFNFNYPLHCIRPHTPIDYPRTSIFFTCFDNNKLDKLS